MFLRKNLAWTTSIAISLHTHITRFLYWFEFERLNILRTFLNFQQNQPKHSYKVHSYQDHLSGRSPIIWSSKNPQDRTKFSLKLHWIWSSKNCVFDYHDRHSNFLMNDPDVSLIHKCNCSTSHGTCEDNEKLLFCIYLFVLFFPFSTLDLKDLKPLLKN